MTAIEHAVDDETAALIEAVARDAAAEDGVAPLGEQPLRSLRSGDEQAVRHLLVRGDEGDVAGYAQLDGSGGEATAEMVVAPGHRRRGVGSELVRAVFDLEPSAAVWAHGDLPAARALAGRS
ncbi:GNAT family N-acetyltransferase, partial [Dietzia sp. Cai40]|uniref:GNAT family N-acetyltransferase n=1 Tax=Dietzia sp. Cai40 TaxID=1630635 RepID=UPI0015FE7741